jgi:hypothetical protein
MLAVIKASLAGASGFILGVMSLPVLAQVAQVAGTEIPALPSQLEAGVLGFCIALLVWALRRSDSDRVQDAKDYAETIRRISESSVAKAERYAEQSDQARQEYSALCLQLHHDLMDELRHKIEGSFVDKAGTVTVSSTTTTIREDQAGWNVVLDNSGTTIRVRVTGATNNNVTWHLSKFETGQVNA